MAEANYTPSATNNDSEASSPNVSSDAVKAREGLSRRQAMTMMTAVTATPALGFVPAQPAFAQSANRSEWDSAMAAFKHAEQESERLGARYYAVEERFFELRQKIPHITVGPDLYTGRTQPVSTEDIAMVRDARRLVSDLAEGRVWLDPGLRALEEHAQFCRNLAAAADKRDAQVEALDAELGYSKANDAHDAAVDQLCEARDRLIEMPAPDGEALLWKLQWLFFEDSIWQEGYVDQTIADARRFLRAAAH